MERKSHNSLYEAAQQVWLDEGVQKTVRKAKAGKLSVGQARAAIKKQEMRYDKGPYEPSGWNPGDHPNWGDDYHRKTGMLRYAKRPKPRLDAKEKNVKKIKDAWIESQPKTKIHQKGLGRIDAGVEYDEVDSMVLEYFSNYFGDELNEDTFDGDIMDAVKDLILLTEAVCEAVGLDEISVETAARAATARQNREVVRDEPRKRGDKQVAKNIMHVYKKAEKMGIDPEHPDIEKEMKKGAEGEQKKMTKTQKERLLSKARHDALEKRVFKHLESE